MGLCGCNLKEKLECSNGIHDGKNWHQIRISRSVERQKICRIVVMKIWLRAVSLFSVVRRARRETRKWPRAWLKARDGRGTRAATLVSRASRLRRSRARALLSLNLKKKRDCSQSIWRSDEIFFAQKNLAASVVDGTYAIKTWTWLMNWNTYQGHEFDKTFHYCIIRRSEATWGLLIIMSRYCSRKHVGTVCVLKFRSA